MGPWLGEPASFESSQVEPGPWMLFRPVWLKPCNTDFALKLSRTRLLCGKCSNLFQIKWQGALNSDNLIPISSAALKYDPLTLDFTWVNKLTSFTTVPLWERESQCAFVPYVNTHCLEYAVFVDFWSFNIKTDNFVSLL